MKSLKREFEDFKITSEEEVVDLTEVRKRIEEEKKAKKELQEEKKPNVHQIPTSFRKPSAERLKVVR